MQGNSGVIITYPQVIHRVICLLGDILDTKEQYYSTELFNRIEYQCCAILDMLALEEEQRIALESFFGKCLDETYEEGLRVGMAQIIESDLDFGE